MKDPLVLPLLCVLYPNFFDSKAILQGSSNINKSIQKYKIHFILIRRINTVLGPPFNIFNDHLTWNNYLILYGKYLRHKSGKVQKLKMFRLHIYCTECGSYCFKNNDTLVLMSFAWGVPNILLVQYVFHIV